MMEMMEDRKVWRLNLVLTPRNITQKRTMKREKEVVQRQQIKLYLPRLGAAIAVQTSPLQIVQVNICVEKIFLYWYLFCFNITRFSS